MVWLVVLAIVYFIIGLFAATLDWEWYPRNRYPWVTKFFFWPFLVVYAILTET